MVEVKKEKCLLYPKDIKPSSKDFEVLGVLNPAAVRMPNGNILLYIRVIEKLIKTEDEKYCYSPRQVGKKQFKIKIDKIDKQTIEHKSDLDIEFKDKTKRLTFISHFRKVVLDKTGFKVLRISRKPDFFGVAKDGEFGVEDPRITKMTFSEEGKEKCKYVMTYVTLSRDHNISSSLAVSDDLKNWERKGIIFGEQDKDVVIFPEKVNGKYVAFDRPESNFKFSLPHIWIAYSDDLKQWGGLKSINLLNKYDKEYGYGRNGAGPPPIKIDKGWLLIYHAVSEHKINPKQKKLIALTKRIFGLEDEAVHTIPIYAAGAGLFDLEKPEKLIAKSKGMILTPTEEHVGAFEEKRVIFPTGIVEDTNGKDLLLFCGRGDAITTVKRISLKDVMKSMRKVK